MRDPSWRTEYGPKTSELVTKHGGKFLVRGATPERMEGNTPTGASAGWCSPPPSPRTGTTAW